MSNASWMKPSPLEGQASPSPEGGVPARAASALDASAMKRSVTMMPVATQRQQLPPSWPSLATTDEALNEQRGVNGSSRVVTEQRLNPQATGARQSPRPLDQHQV